LEAVGKIRRYMAGLSQEAFSEDERTLDAVVCNLEVIGEAIKKVPAKIRSKHPEVEWKKIVGSSNFTAPGLTSNRELNLAHKALLDLTEVDDREAAYAVSWLSDAKPSEPITPENRPLLKSEVGARAIKECVGHTPFNSSSIFSAVACLVRLTQLSLSRTSLRLRELREFDRYAWD